MTAYPVRGPSDPPFLSKPPDATHVPPKTYVPGSLWLCPVSQRFYVITATPPVWTSRFDNDRLDDVDKVFDPETNLKDHVAGITWWLEVIDLTKKITRWLSFSNAAMWLSQEDYERFNSMDISEVVSPGILDYHEKLRQIYSELDGDSDDEDDALTDGGAPENDSKSKSQKS